MSQLQPSSELYHVSRGISTVLVRTTILVVAADADTGYDHHGRLHMEAVRMTSRVVIMIVMSKT